MKPKCPATQEDRRALLALAQLYGIDLAAIGTERPDGAVTLDWDVLATAVSEAQADRHEGCPATQGGHDAMSNHHDSYLRCTECGREDRTNFSFSLRNGWPKCCGYTMRLERTDADIGAAVGDATAPLKAVRRATQ